jgi:tetratricopeptide (TPR) repeat protein
MEKKLRELKQSAIDFKAKGHFEAAIKCLEEAVVLAGSDYPNDLANLLNRLADAYRLNGQLRHAEKACRRAIQIELEFGGGCAEISQHDAPFLHLSTILAAQGRFKEALEALDQGLEPLIARLGNDDYYVKTMIERRKFLADNAWKG